MRENYVNYGDTSGGWWAGVDSRDTFRIQLLRYADGLDVECKWKRSVKVDPMSDWACYTGNGEENRKEPGFWL